MQIALILGDELLTLLPVISLFDVLQVGAALGSQLQTADFLVSKHELLGHIIQIKLQAMFLSLQRVQIALELIAPVVSAAQLLCPDFLLALELSEGLRAVAASVGVLVFAVASECLGYAELLRLRELATSMSISAIQNVGGVRVKSLLQRFLKTLP